MLRRLRGVLGMGLIWAVGGAMIGGLIELVDNIAPGLLPFAKNVDMWPQTLAIPGFLGGIIFGALLALAARRRRFDELSLPGFTALGAAGGLLLGAWGTSNGLPAMVMGLTTAGGALAASGSLWIARVARRRELDALVEPDEEPPSIEAREATPPSLPGRRP